MKVISTWDKTNAVESKVSDEFLESGETPLGEDGEFLIKLPKVHSDIFFRLNAAWAHQIDFVSDEPLNGHKIFYTLDQKDNDFPIEIYDNDKKLIRSITTKDLYYVDICCSKDFIRAVSDAIVRITIYAKNMDKRMSYIAKAEPTKNVINGIISFDPIINRHFNDPTIQFLGYVMGDRIMDYDMKFEILDTLEFEEYLDNMFF
ncbi:MAG: hypothetical protein IKU29_03950 [Parabacteroides sp.]|nr:hypothetical protein [Parabacteroides sp.]